MVQDIIPENEWDPVIMESWEVIHSWGWGKFIPFEECFEKFNVPDGDRIEDRIKNNLIYYRTNYLALYGAMLLIVAFSHPGFAVLDFCIALLWLLPFVVVPHPFVLGDYRVTPSAIVAATVIICILTFLITRSFFFFLLFNLFFLLLVILHSVLRNDSVKSRISVNFNEKRKEFMRN